MNYDLVKEKYDDFIYTNEERMDKEFHEQNQFRTTIRGFKIRGSYNTHEEAQQRVEVLKRSDKNHLIYIAQVGYWCPWEPNPDKIEEQVYDDSELNTLVGKQKENKIQTDM